MFLGYFGTVVSKTGCRLFGYFSSIFHILKWATPWENFPSDMRLAKTQISQYICAVWSGYSLSAWRNFASLTIQNVQSEDSDQTAGMCRLIWIWCTCPKVHFLTLRLFSQSAYQFDLISLNASREKENDSHGIFLSVILQPWKQKKRILDSCSEIGRNNQRY